MTYKNSEKDKLYWKFEEMLASSSDEQLFNILMKFNRKDFLELPIVVDLIVEQRFNILDILHKQNIPLNYTNRTTGSTALHVASAISGSLAAVEFLFKNNIFTDINAMTDERETPFLLAVMYGHDDIVKFYFDHAKPDLTINTIYGETAFLLAKKSGNKKIINLLKKHNAPEEIPQNIDSNLYRGGPVPGRKLKL